MNLIAGILMINLIPGTTGLVLGIIWIAIGTLLLVAAVHD